MKGSGIRDQGSGNGSGSAFRVQGSATPIGDGFPVPPFPACRDGSQPSASSGQAAGDAPVRSGEHCSPWADEAAGNRQQATGNRQQATGQGTGNREPGIGDGGTDCHDQSADLSDGPNMQASARHIWLPELMQSWSRNDKMGPSRPCGRLQNNTKVERE